MPLLATMLPPAQTAIAGTTSLGSDDPNKLIALCSLVVGKLVKKVKELEDKLKGRKRKFVMTKSDLEEEEEQDVDPLIKLAKAAATAADEFNYTPYWSIPPDVTTGPTDAPSGKGKSPMFEKEPPVRERSFRQREEDRLGAEVARRLYEEEQADCLYSALEDLSRAGPTTDLIFYKTSGDPCSSQLGNKNIILVNVIPPAHLDDVPVVDPNQHDDVPVVPEPIIEDEDEDPEEDEFQEEEDPQEEDDDMKVDIEEDDNEPELTYPYEKVNPLNPLPPTSESKPDDAIEVENSIKHEDEIVPASVYEVGELSTAPFLHKDSDSLLPGLMRRDINSLFGRMASLSRRLCGRETTHALVEKKGKEKDEYYGRLILDLGNEVRSSVEQGTAAMEKLVEKLGNAEDKVEWKRLKKEF
ncbi:hypothetical protein Tco_1135074 [Tanacetum coccineum]